MYLLEAYYATVVLVLTATVLLLYRHYTKLHRCGISGPTPWPFIGNSLQQQKLGTENADKIWLKKYGKVYAMYIDNEIRYQGLRMNVVVADSEVLKSVFIKDFTNFHDRVNRGNIPSLLQNGLFFMSGRRWKRTRNIITPTFSAGKLKHMIPVINDNARVLVDTLCRHMDESVMVKDYFTHFTMDTIASTAFSLDISSQTRPDNPYVRNMKNVFNSSTRGVVSMILNSMIPGIAPLLYKLGLSFWSQECADFYESMGAGLIAERKANKEKHHEDFLDLLMNAEFDDSKSEHLQKGAKLATDSTGAPKQQIERLTEEEINGQLFTFFLAGMETTASLLRFSAYTLALHPDIDARLVDEILEHIGMDDPTYDTVNNLKYMDQFINEVLRFYPPVPKLNRITKEDIQIGGMTIPRGASILIPIWMIHHSEENYPSPETFDPERFSSENKGAVDSVNFLAFGCGPRHCIGRRLALVEAKVALVYMLRKLKFVKSDKTQIPLDLSHFGILKPTQPIQVRLQAR